MITGNTLAFIIVMPFGGSFYEIMLNLFTSFITSTIGSFLFTGFALGFGVFNMIWFILYAKSKE